MDIWVPPSSKKSFEDQLPKFYSDISWRMEENLVDYGFETGKIYDKKWRLNHLYFVKHAKEDDFFRFKMEDYHEDILHLLYGPSPSKRVLVLKSRQVYITTFAVLDMIDCCWCERSRKCIVSNWSREEADLTVQEKAHDIVDHSPILNIQDCRKTNFGVEFPKTRSLVRVSITARGHKSDYILVTEFAKTSDEDPRKAREVKKGMFAGAEWKPAIIESTGKGEKGPFPEMVHTARMQQLEGRPVTPKTWQLIFLGWWRKKLNRTETEKTLYSEELARYYKHEIEEVYDVKLDEQQKNWYADTLENDHSNDLQGMRQEQPSTIEEALATDDQGYILRQDILRMLDDGRIGDWRHYPGRPVVCFWDLGFNDNTAVIFVQKDPAANSYTIFDSITNSGKKLEFYFNELSKKQYNITKHVLPWDAESSRQHLKKLMATEKDSSIEGAFHREGMKNTLVMKKCSPKRAGFEASRGHISLVNIGSHLSTLIDSLRNVKKHLKPQTGHYDDQLQPGQAENHFYDCFELFARSALAYPEMWDLRHHQRGQLHPYDPHAQVRRRLNA